MPGGRAVRHAHRRAPPRRAQPRPEQLGRPGAAAVWPCAHDPPAVRATAAAAAAAARRAPGPVPSNTTSPPKIVIATPGSGSSPTAPRQRQGAVEHADVGHPAGRERALPGRRVVLPRARGGVGPQRVEHADPLLRPGHVPAHRCPARSTAAATPDRQSGGVTGQSEAEVSVHARVERAAHRPLPARPRSGPSTGIIESAISALIAGFMFAPRPCAAIRRSARSVIRSEWIV